MRTDQLKIAVIGAGIAGLTTALALRQRGAVVTIFEQSAQLAEVGAGIQISANALCVLKALGLAPQQSDNPVMTTAVQMIDGTSNRNLARLAMNTDTALPYYLFHRADLITMLADAVSAAGIGVTLGCRAEINVGPFGKYRISTAGSEPLEFDVIVAADGVRSSACSDLLAVDEPVFTGQAAWRGIVEARHLPQLQGAFQQRVYVGAGRHVVTYPLRGGELINVVAVTERKNWTEEGWNFRDDPVNLRREFAGWCSDVTNTLDLIEEPIFWGLFSHRPLTRWSDGNTVILGDAAHPMLPFLAQGACMGIEDAWVLADSLARAEDVKSALAMFEAIRKPRATAVQRASAANGRMFHIQNPVQRKVAHAGINLVGKFAPFLIRRRYDWIYSHDVTTAQNQAAQI